jgi:dehydrogenase/reductase SDR family protein 4
VTVNCVALGSMRTGALAEALDRDPSFEQKLARPYMIPRVGLPSDPAGVVTLLCSDQASWITGQVYAVNGGYFPGL